MTESEPDPTEHGPAESARPTLDRRDQPDAIRPDPIPSDTDERPHRTLPPDEEDADDGSAAPGGR
jgi:hypothetical protein